MDCSPPGSSIHGIFQARVLEWGAIAFCKMHTTIYKINNKDFLSSTGNLASLVAQSVRESTSNGGLGDPGLIPGLRRTPGEGNGNSLQYSCLGNPMKKGALWAIVHGVTKVS